MSARISKGNIEYIEYNFADFRKYTTSITLYRLYPYKYISTYYPSLRGTLYPCDPLEPITPLEFIINNIYYYSRSCLISPSMTTYPSISRLSQKPKLPKTNLDRHSKPKNDQNTSHISFNSILDYTQNSI